MDRTGEAAATFAFNDLEEALVRYLHALGWTEVVFASAVGLTRRMPPGNQWDQWEFVVYFTGKPRDEPAEEVSHGHRRWSS